MKSISDNDLFLANENISTHQKSVKMRGGKRPFTTLRVIHFKKLPSQAKLSDSSACNSNKKKHDVGAPDEQI
jgi:hypothetical protein